MKDYGPAVAAGIILAGTALVLLLMPRLMAAVSGGGPWAGLAVALAAMLAFFGVFWLRARYKARRPGGPRDG
ncbi:hypothetical protein ACUN0C_13805 [Faunimonas sp. B44]|uniref:hypothetical protein n=1 Tax=Faunimonas sp. B44 TaxID=3461493 RepID=UPI004044D450